MKISIRTLLLTAFLAVTMSFPVLAANSYTEYNVANTQSLPICGLYQMQYTVGDNYMDQHNNWFVAIEPYDGTHLLFSSQNNEWNSFYSYLLSPTDNPLIWGYQPWEGYDYTNYISLSQDGTQLVWPREEEGTSYLKKIG